MSGIGAPGFETPREFVQRTGKTLTGTAARTTLILGLRGDEVDSTAAAMRTLELVSQGGIVLNGFLSPIPTDGDGAEPADMGEDLASLARKASESDEVEAMPKVLAMWPLRVDTILAMRKGAFNNREDRL